MIQKDDKLDYLFYETYAQALEFTLDNNELCNFSGAEYSVVMAVNDVVERAQVRLDLSRAGFKVQAANDYHQFIYLIDVITPPQAIVLDLTLPNFGSYQLIEYVRKTRAWRDIPILVVATAETENLITYALHVGASNYLIKPYRVAELISRLHDLIMFSLQQNSVRCAA